MSLWFESASAFVKNVKRVKAPSEIIAYIIITVIAGGCHLPRLNEFRDYQDNPEGYLTVWALSDIQPKNAAQRRQFESSVDDTNGLSHAPHMAIVAGDIAHHRQSGPDFRWYIDTKKKSRIPHWFEIAGNHDMKDELNYRKLISSRLHYSVTVGNALFLFMSDEDRFPAQKISDSTFLWWKDKVEKNQDKIIVTVTHAYLRESRLIGSFIESRNIAGSERFAEVLRKYRVDLWICGHTHIPSVIKGKWNIPAEFKNTLFMNVSSIRDDLFIGSESAFLILGKGTDRALIRYRNHTSGKFILTMELWHSLSRNFEWDGSPPAVQY